MIVKTDPKFWNNIPEIWFLVVNPPIKTNYNDASRYDQRDANIAFPASLYEYTAFDGDLFCQHGPVFGLVGK